MDHDGLNKKLFTVFFMEFVEAFLPEAAKQIDPDYIEFLDKETFSGIRSRRRKEMDLVVKVRFKNQKEAFFLIHVEHQSSNQSDFPKRMFRYYIRLIEKYNLPVYPVAIFSYDTPTTPAPASYEDVVLDKTVVHFNYTAIQLNRIPWRRFIKQPNPVATALMTKMRIPERDRPKVRSQCMRLLATLKLTPEKAELIYVYIESYLKLTPAENAIYERELAKFDTEIKETAMEIISSARKEGRKEGRREGRQEGRQEGKEELLTLILRQQFSTLPSAITEKLDKLTSEQMNELGVELFNFKSLAELEEWLAHR